MVDRIFGHVLLVKIVSSDMIGSYEVNYRYSLSRKVGDNSFAFLVIS